MFEKVNPSHPDKIRDRIKDILAVLTEEDAEFIRRTLNGGEQ